MLISHTPLIQEKKKKSAAWQSSTDSSHPSVDTKGLFWGLLSNQWWDHEGLCHYLLSTHRTLTAVLWSENAQEKEDVKEVSSVISFQRGERRRTGQCIWVLRTKPETQCNRWLWVTRFCSLYLSQHHWHLHFIVWRCQGKCVASIPASPTEQWLCHFEISVGVDPFPNRFLKSPLGTFIFNIYVILVLCGYFLPVSGLPFISLVEIRV